ncbi:MAG: hypothetical protein ABR581_05045 [Thermoleophilaceae bacterium]
MSWDDEAHEAAEYAAMPAGYDTWKGATPPEYDELEPRPATNRRADLQPWMCGQRVQFWACSQRKGHPGRCNTFAELP